ncbi:MAG: histidine phosphatase family protein [Planctomycetota bacterium]|nr:MAG: histidine phosphatase family protein [Planctomycetota bacterium]
MAEILLIRHGQSANNALDEALRVCDPNLTEVGRRQAIALADHLQDQAIDRLYCSPFRRSLETTRPIADRLGIRPSIRADIFEQGGCYSGYQVGQRRGEPGLGAVHLQQEYPGWEIDSRIDSAGWWNRPYESREQAIRRAASVRRWLETDVASQGGRHALIIHADFKFLLLQELLGADAAELQGLFAGSLWNAGISRLCFQGSQWIASTLNDASHLAPDQRTR